LGAGIVTSKEGAAPGLGGWTCLVFFIWRGRNCCGGWTSIGHWTVMGRPLWGKSMGHGVVAHIIIN